jgi:hypothetical protein
MKEIKDKEIKKGKIQEEDSVNMKKVKKVRTRKEE